MDLDQRNDRNNYSNRGGVEKKTSYTKYILIGALVILGFWMFRAYNGITKADITAEDSWAKVQTAYQARADKVKNLTAIVKGAADFEKSTLTEVIEARSKATSVTIDPSNLTPEKIAQFEAAQGELTQALSKLLVTVERYPDLKAVQSFRDFQVQYEGIENRIKKARDDYNSSVRNYNIKIRTFPNNVFNIAFGFEKKGFFKAQEGAENAPDIEF